MEFTGSFQIYSNSKNCTNWVHKNITASKEYRPGGEIYSRIQWFIIRFDQIKIEISYVTGNYNGITFDNDDQSVFLIKKCDAQEKLLREYTDQTKKTITLPNIETGILTRFKKRNTESINSLIRRIDSR